MTQAAEAATTVAGPAIVVDDVTKTFELNGRPLDACSEVSFTVEAGEFVTIIGPSGCGKSTLLRLIADLLPPTGGRVLIDGLPAREARLERKLGMVFQDAVLLPWRSVLRNVELPLQVSGVDSRTRRQRAQQLVDLVGLKGFEKARPRALSGGMARRAAIARALVMEPSILLMDEPFGALDEITRQTMNQALLEIWSRTETTALLVTHSVSEAVFLSDRVLVMSARPGRIGADIPIGLPRPRSVDLLQDEEFFKASARLMHELTEVVNAGVQEGFR